MSSIKITIDLTNSPHVVLDRENTLKLLNCLLEETTGSRDLEETLRIINSFDEYYRYMKKKFEDYITPQKDQREVLLGRSIIHKIKLFIDSGEKYVELVFDRRFNVDYIKKCLENIGFDKITIEKQLL